MSRRVLLLSASAGAGHLRAAAAVEAAVRVTDPAATVEHWDVLEHADPAFRDAYSKWYLELVNRAPALWGYLYDRLDRPAASRPLSLRKILNDWNTRRLRRELRTFAPDAIVCTHFLPVEVLSAMRRAGRLAAPLGVVVTDADVHRLWVHRGVDQWFVPREEAAELLVRIGFPRPNVTITGIPIDPRFATPVDRAEARRKLDLPVKGEGVVLLLAGGFGVGPVEDLAQRLEEARRPDALIVVAGKNERLRAALAASAGPRTRVLGFTTEIDVYMAAADILVTKPGGLTTSEALARGLPMVLVNPIPGQEARNADMLLEAGAAVRANSLDLLGWKVDQLLGDASRMAALRSAATALAKPRAAFDVARWTLSA